MLMNRKRASTMEREINGLEPPQWTSVVSTILDVFL
jgi:hypothetical protein